MTSGQPSNQAPSQLVLGEEALRMLAVPTRFSLLSHLVELGPATATQCAAVVGASPSNCSWHLRSMAAAGLVERVEPEPGGRGDARQRPWRASARGFDLSGAGSPAAASAAQAVGALLHRREQEQLGRHLASREGLPGGWQQVSGTTRLVLRATVEELSALLEAFAALAEPYRAGEHPDPALDPGAPGGPGAPAPGGAAAGEEARTVVLSVTAFPHPDR